MTDTGKINKGMAAQVFQEVEILKSLMLHPDEQSWIEKPPHRVQPVPTLLYLGCNILRTPHLARTVTAVFEKSGEDFLSLGGPNFCCGLPFEYEGKREDASRWGERLVNQFQRFQPERVVMWCPGCLNFYRNVLQISSPFRLLHVTEFLAERRDRFSFTPQPDTKIALHYHVGSPDIERQAEAARTLLRAVPGLEILEIGSSEALGRNCSGRSRDGMGREAWDALLMSFFQKADEMNADVFATLYHGCHRTHACYEDRFSFAIEHYLTSLARALGIEYPDKYKEYMAWRDRERILEDARDRLTANRIELDLAIPLIDHVFVEGKGF